jgi:hypothetical protein
MVTVTIEKGRASPPSVPPMGRGIAAVRELGLRVIGAGLQILATVAVVQALAPPVAGIYFRGAIVCYGLAALLRGKYDLFVAQHFVSPLAPGSSGLPHGSSGPASASSGQKSDLGDEHARAVVRGLGIRVLIRSAIACALLLVFTTDLDVMDVYLRPYLQTYLPFVLAVPFATLALFLASTLRAVNHTVGSVMVSSYSINALIIVAANAIPTVMPEAPLFVVSWGFFVGCVLAAGMGVLLTRHVFRVPRHPKYMALSETEWREIYTSTGRNGVTGVALAALQWGPACVLAVFGTAIAIAEYAVAIRTAQIIDFLVPAVIFVPHSARIQSRLCQAMHSARGKLTVDLSVSLATTTTCVLAVGIATPLLFVGWYGPAYSGLMILFILVFLVQWVAGAARPAVRQLAAHWDLRRIRRIMFVSMAGAIIVSLAGVNDFGPLAAAVGGLVGALLFNGQALEAAFRQVRTQAQPAS